MHSGFNLSISKSDWNKERFELRLQQGNKLYSAQRKGFEQGLDGFRDKDGKISARLLRTSNFPLVEGAEIFISHSHKDRDLAIAIAGALDTEFGIKSFIDSCFWSDFRALQLEIDTEYSIHHKEANGDLIFSYEKANVASSHVFMLLTSALTEMIDSASYVFFLNTPNSIVLDEDVTETESPWIYMEILMTRLIRRKLTKTFSEKAVQKAIENKLEVRYDVDVSHLIDLTAGDFFELLKLQTKTDFLNSLRNWT